MSPADIIASLEKLTGPSTVLDHEIYWHFSEWENLGGWWRRHKVTGEREQFNFTPPPPVTESLDAIVALIEQVMPGTNRTIRKRYRTTAGIVDGHVYDAHISGGDVCEGASEPTACCIALLRTMEAGKP